MSSTPSPEHPSDDAELAVILAAGEGSRLIPHQAGPPKPVLPLLGLSLVERTVLACLKAGIRRFLFVLGHREEEVRAHVAEMAARRGCEVDFVTASDWRLGNGASALAAAEKVADRSFLLLMVDHRVDPSVIQAVRQTPLGPGEICLAVDRDKEQVFDLDDVTKVTLRNGRVAQLGKSLERWDAADMGVFRCTAALFEELRGAAAAGRHSLTDGVNRLAANGGVIAVDMTGQAWLDIDTSQAYREATRRLRHSLAKGREDGYISTYVNRPISTRLSAWLATTPITPNQITVISFLVSLIGAACLALGESVATVLTVLGALLVQGSSIVDGCDGEVARLKHLASARGAWLDTLLDRYSDMAVTLAITFACASQQAGGSGWIWAGGFVAGTGFLLTSYATKEFMLCHGHPYPDHILLRLKKRDLRLFVICAGALLGHAFAAVLAMGALSHACVFGILAMGWRTTGRASPPQPS